MEEGLNLIRQHSTKEIINTRKEWYIRGKRYHEANRKRVLSVVAKRREVMLLNYY